MPVACFVGPREPSAEQNIPSLHPAMYEYAYSIFCRREGSRSEDVVASVFSATLVKCKTTALCAGCLAAAGRDPPVAVGLGIDMVAELATFVVATDLAEELAA
jgi:hypothetical protein